MTEHEVRTLGERFVHEYACGGQSSAAESILANDFVAYVPAREEPIRGRAAHIEMNASWHRAIPDFTYKLEGIAVDASQVVVRFSWSGTHTGGPLMDVEPSGRGVVVRNEVHWLEARDGLLVTDHALMDLGNVVAQLQGSVSVGR